MDKGESKYKFREADSLYRKRRYEEALTLLEQLDQAYPNTRQVLFPLARTLARLERYPESIELLERVLSESDYEPAQKLKEKLEERSAAAPVIDISKFDDEISGSFNFDSAPPASHMDESPASAKVTWVLSAGLILVFAILAVGLSTIGVEFTEWQSAVAEQPEVVPPIPVASMIFHIVLNLTLGLIAGCVGGYCALAVVQALPYADFESNLKDVALYNVYGLLLSPIVIIGWIAFLVILKRHYALGVGALIVVVFIYSVIGGAISFGLGFFLGLISAFL